MAKEKIETYEEAARAIAVWLEEFCDETKAYPEMIADATKKAMRSLTFYRERIEELERHKDEFPEPYYTMICNILANGRIRP